MGLPSSAVNVNSPNTRDLVPSLLSFMAPQSFLGTLIRPSAFRLPLSTSPSLDGTFHTRRLSMAELPPSDTAYQ